MALVRPHLVRAYLASSAHHRPAPRLTERQRDVLRLVARGDTNFQIGYQLGMAEGTVRTHVNHILERLNVTSRTAAALAVFGSEEHFDF